MTPPKLVQGGVIDEADRAVEAGGGGELGEADRLTLASAHDVLVYRFLDTASDGHPHEARTTLELVFNGKHMEEVERVAHRPDGVVVFYAEFISNTAPAVIDVVEKARHLRLPAVTLLLSIMQASCQGAEVQAAAADEGSNCRGPERAEVEATGSKFYLSPVWRRASGVTWL